MHIWDFSTLIVLTGDLSIRKIKLFLVQFITTHVEKEKKKQQHKVDKFLSKLNTQVLQRPNSIDKKQFGIGIKLPKYWKLNRTASIFGFCFHLMSHTRAMYSCYRSMSPWGYILVKPSPSILRSLICKPPGFLFFRSDKISKLMPVITKKGNLLDHV